MSSPKSRNARRRDKQNLVQISRHFSRLFFASLIDRCPMQSVSAFVLPIEQLPLLKDYRDSQVLAKLPRYKHTDPRYAQGSFKPGTLGSREKIL